MAKISPAERWHKDAIERCQIFALSSDLQRLRGLGLGILGRVRLVPQDEWWEETKGWGRMASKEYLAFQIECRQTGLIFGLADWTVEWICLLEGFEPEYSAHVLAAQWPTIRVVTESTDESFLEWLLYEAWQLGVYVVRRDGSIVTGLICIPFPQQPEEPLTSSQRPPLASAFTVSMEIPPGYPPEAAAELARKVAQMERGLARKLGYKMPYRMRNSPLTARSAELKVGQELSSGDIYDIVDETNSDGDLTEDQKLRNRVKSQRNRVSKRIRDRRIGG